MKLAGVTRESETVAVTDVNAVSVSFTGGYTGSVLKSVNVYYETCADDGNLLAATLSAGNMTIILCLVCLALGLVGGLLIGRKKRVKK